MLYHKLGMTQQSAVVSDELRNWHKQWGGSGSSRKPLQAAHGDHHGELRAGSWNTLPRKRREVNHGEDGLEISGGEAKTEDMAGGK